jgi:hypothetical protein
MVLMPWIDEKTPPRLEITNEALDLYARMRTIIKCTCPPPPKDAAYWDVAPDCENCVEFALLNRALAPLVGLPLWEVYCVPPPSGECFIEAAEQARRNALEQALAEREGK